MRERARPKAGITTDDIDWVVCHQANVRILDASIRRLGMPAEKFYRNLDRYANTSAASIPLRWMKCAKTACCSPAKDDSRRLRRRSDVGGRIYGGLT
ncbi:MAG: 3-oxoacyl-[acyl-carrier-protein] synthase III C-terminal domain-containing protein [Christensenellales bacterium]